MRAASLASFIDMRKPQVLMYSAKAKAPNLFILLLVTRASRTKTRWADFA